VLVAGAGAGQAAWFNVETGELARLLPLQGGARGVAFSPDGTVVAAGTQSGDLVLWNAQTGDLIANNGTHRSVITDIAFSPDGRWLATVSSDRTSRLFDAQTGAYKRVLLDDGIDLTALAFSPDSQTVFILSYRMRYAVDVASTRVLNAASNASSSHNDFAISPSGRTLLAAGFQDRILAQEEDFGVHTIQTSTLSGLGPHAVSYGHSNGVAMHPSGQSVAVAGDDGYIRYFALSEDPDRATLSIAYIRENGSDFIPLGGQAEPGSLWSDRAGFYRNRVALERPIVWRPYCGNGVLDDGELFDNGQPWEPSTEYHISCGATCGDGFVHQGEGCDDGNNEAGDGCSRLCQVE
jgi:cysteine-rich repeat protein